MIELFSPLSCYPPVVLFPVCHLCLLSSPSDAHINQCPEPPLKPWEPMPPAMVKPDTGEPAPPPLPPLRTCPSSMVSAPPPHSRLR